MKQMLAIYTQIIHLIIFPYVQIDNNISIPNMKETKMTKIQSTKNLKVNFFGLNQIIILLLHTWFTPITIVSLVHIKIFPDQLCRYHKTQYPITVATASTVCPVAPIPSVYPQWDLRSWSGGIWMCIFVHMGKDVHSNDTIQLQYWIQPLQMLCITAISYIVFYSCITLFCKSTLHYDTDSNS